MISETLRLLRVFHDKKLREMASDLEISSSYLSKIETGKIDPSLEILQRYAEQFKTTRSSILFLADELDENNEIGPFKMSIRNKLYKILKTIDNFDGNER